MNMTYVVGVVLCKRTVDKGLKIIITMYKAALPTVYKVV